MQALFFIDSELYSPDEIIELFCYNFEPTENVRSFFDIIIGGVLQHKNEIDAIIAENSKNWKLSRMPSVDRNILRIAVFELLYLKDIPSKVTINEAIDIGKKFGTRDSGAFINGILDSIKLTHFDPET